VVVRVGDTIRRPPEPPGGSATGKASCRAKVIVANLDWAVENAPGLSRFLD